MIASGMDENSAEVTTLRLSLTKAKRNAQDAEVAVQVKGAQEMVDRAQRRLDAHDKLRKDLEVELAEGQARLQRLRRQAEEEANSPPAVQKPPPEWVSEIHKLSARFKASANRPVRFSVEAAMSVSAKAEKRRAGVLDNIPADEQSLRAWMEDKHLEMRDTLDANDAEAIVSLGAVIARSDARVRDPCVHDVQHGDHVRCTIVRAMNSWYGLRSVRAVEASHPGPASERRRTQRLRALQRSMDSDGESSSDEQPLVRSACVPSDFLSALEQDLCGS